MYIKRIGFRLFILVLLAVGVAGSVFVPFLWRNEANRLIEGNKELIARLAQQNAAKVTDDHCQEREGLKAFAETVSGSSLTDVHGFLKKILSQPDEDKWLRPRTAGVAYEDGRIVRYTMTGAEPEEVNLTYDHTDEGEQAGKWYRDCLGSPAGKGTWLAPYWGETSQAYILEYGVPFLDPAGEKSGIVYINYSVKHLLKILSRMDLGTTGYAFITYSSSADEDHWIVAHPCSDCLGEPVSEAYPLLNEAMSECLSHNEVVYSQSRDGPIWLYATDIGGMGNYKLCIVMNRQAMAGMSKRLPERRYAQELTQKQSWIICGLFCGLALLGLLMLLIEFIPDRRVRMRFTSAVFSLLCLGEIIFLWIFCSANRASHSENYHLTDAGVAGATVQQLVKEGSSSLHLIRTGIFIQSIKFTSPYEVKMTGYVWQRKNPAGEVHENIFSYEDDALVVFPEAEAISISKKFENEEVIGSYFETTLRQPFDYTQFPFDQQDIWIRMWPNNFADNTTVLIPDFESYVSVFDGDAAAGKTLAIGMEEDVVLEGWDIKNTFFSYGEKSYSMNFAAGENTKLSRPELHFNMLVERRLGGMMISHVLPISVVSILLFGVVMIKTDNKEKSGLLGFSVATVLAYCASLFFVLIVSHISMRNRLETPYFVYLEGFYFVMYLQLLLVSMHDLLFVLSKKGSLLRRDNGAFQKLLYWPTLTLLILLITLFSFF